MLAQFAIPHAASPKPAKLFTLAHSTSFALRRYNLRRGTLVAHYSRVQQAFRRSVHTSYNLSVPRPIPVSAFFTAPSYTTPSLVSRRPILVQQRHCSYQRNMCRHHFGTDVAESHIDVSKSREVLPKNVKPLHYQLTLEPNLETFEFNGQVDIE